MVYIKSKKGGQRKGSKSRRSSRWKATKKYSARRQKKESRRRLTEKITLTDDVSSVPIFSDGKDTLSNYFRIPITKGILAQRFGAMGPDDRYRLSKVLRVRGVASRMNMGAFGLGETPPVRQGQKSHLFL